MSIGRVRYVPEEEKEGERDGEEADELSVGGGHAVALAVHFYRILASQILLCCVGEGTPRSLLLDPALQAPVEAFTRHLTSKHHHNLDLAIAPYQGRVDDAEALRDESEPCAEERDAVGWVLQVLAGFMRR